MEAVRCCHAPGETPCKYMLRTKNTKYSPTPAGGTIGKREQGQAAAGGQFLIFFKKKLRREAENARAYDSSAHKKEGRQKRRPSTQEKR